MRPVVLLHQGLGAADQNRLGLDAPADPLHQAPRGLLVDKDGEPMKERIEVVQEILEAVDQAERHRRLDAMQQALEAQQ
jgi:hypothetical protein